MPASTPQASTFLAHHVCLSSTMPLGVWLACWSDVPAHNHSAATAAAGPDRLGMYMRLGVITMQLPNTQTWNI